MLANAERDRLLALPELNDSLRLEGHGFKGYSQNDEDGIIQEIFRRIGTDKKTFVEFGTENGTQNNTVYLLHQGWKGLWLDGSQQHIDDQKRLFQWATENGQLTSVCSFLTLENINSVIGENGFQGDIDLLSIDIDGNDYHLWKAIDVVSPRVVVIEYNAYVPPPVEWIMPYQEDYVWDGISTYFNSSLASLAKLGISKGYSLVGCNITGLNAFFVRSDLVDGKFCADQDPRTLFHPRRYWLDSCFDVAAVPFDQPFIR